MSTSTAINGNCILRRNVKTQPYGRCSVCTLKLRGCHAWQASLLSFGTMILALSTTVVPAGWPLRLVVVGILVFVIAEGLANHRRTDQLIYRARSRPGWKGLPARLSRLPFSKATSTLQAICLQFQRRCGKRPISLPPVRSFGLPWGPRWRSTMFISSDQSRQRSMPPLPTGRGDGISNRFNFQKELAERPWMCSEG